MAFDKSAPPIALIDGPDYQKFAGSASILQEMSSGIYNRGMR